MAVSTFASHTSHRPASRISGRGVIRTGLVGLILLAAASPVSTSAPVPESYYVPGQAYAVRLTGEQTTFDLPGSSSGQSQSYLLIVSSLGDAASSYRIQLSSPTIAPSVSKLTPSPDSPTPLTPVSQVIKVPPIKVSPVQSVTGIVPSLSALWPSQADVAVENISVNSGRDTSSNEPQSGASQPIGQPLKVAQSITNSTVPKRLVPDRQGPVESGRQKPSTFFIHTGSGPLHRHDAYSMVSARRIGLGQRVEVLLDQRLKPESLAPGLAESIIFELESALIPQMEHTLGSCRDVDGTGRFTVLLTPLLEQLQGGQTRLKGFVRSSDFESHVPSPFSNQCDMLYLNSNLQPGNELRALLAHEFTHAICFSERTTSGPDGDRILDEDDWLNEAIAHLAENLHASNWQNIDHRIDAYLAAPGRYPLVVPDYYRAGLWRNHGCRGATYLFLRLCVDQFGPELLKKLIRSRLRGTHNLSVQTGLQFEDAFRLWTIALASEIDSESPHTADQRSASALEVSRSGVDFKSSGPLQAPFRDGSAPSPSHSEAASSTGDSSADQRMRQVAHATVREGSWGDAETGLRIPRPTQTVGGSMQSQGLDAGQAEVGYQSIRLNGRIGRYELRGPRVLEWCELSQPLRVSVRGTAAEFARVTVEKNTRIRISADPGTRLQVTVIPESRRGDK